MDALITHYGVELDFGDHKETAWWWGQPAGFKDWFGKIDAGYHPRLQAKRAVIKDIEITHTDWEEIHRDQATDQG